MYMYELYIRFIYMYVCIRNYAKSMKIIKWLFLMFEFKFYIFEFTPQCHLFGISNLCFLLGLNDGS